jgi:hypothetical protein
MCADIEGELAETRPFAEMRLKGIHEPVLVFEVLSVSGLESPPVVPQPAALCLVKEACRLGPFPEEGIAAMRLCGRLRMDTRVEPAAAFP